MEQKKAQFSLNLFAGLVSGVIKVSQPPCFGAAAVYPPGQRRAVGKRGMGTEGESELGTPSILWPPSPGQGQRQAFTAGGDAGG